MDISKHPLLKQCYELGLAIEKCGASEELTEASVKAGEVAQGVKKLVNERGNNNVLSVSEDVLKKAFVEYIRDFKDTPNAFDIVTIDTDSVKYSEKITPVFFRKLKQVISMAEKSA